MRPTLKFIFALALVAGALAGWRVGPLLKEQTVIVKNLFLENKKATPPAPIAPEETFLVKRVIDGDTIELENGQRVRYIGMDTPELHDPRKKIECFATAAAEINRQLVEGKKVRLEKDVSETDIYKRLLRYVWVEEILVNDYLVKNGYALLATFPPDVKYASLFRASEEFARENKSGLWLDCANLPIDSNYFK